MQGRELQADLDLDSGDAADPHIRHRTRRIPQQRCLADPRTAPDYQARAEPIPRRPQGVLNRHLLRLAIQQTRPRLRPAPISRQPQRL
jgi:hypothetical protein